MAKRKKAFDLTKGLTDMVKSIDLTAKGKINSYYKETPQVKGRIARAFAKETAGGKGKIAKRSSYKHDMKSGIKQKSRQERGKIVYALARATKGGKGRIAKRPAHKRFVPKK